LELLAANGTVLLFTSFPHWIQNCPIFLGKVTRLQRYYQSSPTNTGSIPNSTSSSSVKFRPGMASVSPGTSKYLHKPILGHEWSIQDLDRISRIVGLYPVHLLYHRRFLGYVPHQPLQPPQSFSSDPGTIGTRVARWPARIRTRSVARSVKRIGRTWKWQ